MAVFVSFLFLLVIQLLPASSYDAQATDCGNQIRLLTRDSSSSRYNMYEGRIEVVCNNRSFSPYICDDSWTVAEAAVACRQLGFSALGAVPRKASFFSAAGYSSFNEASGFGPDLLGDVECNGNETRLVDCQRTGVGSQICTSGNSVGVSCLPPDTQPVCQDGDVRLVGRSSPTEGHLLFCYDSVWGAVCSTYFDDTDATVACKQMGISNIGIKQFFSRSAEDVYHVLRLNSNGCTGNENQFTNCSLRAIGDTDDCRSTASVKCITGVLLVQRLSGGEIFAILFFSLLFVGSIIVLILGLAYYKQRQYKKLVRTHSSSDTSETAQRMEQVGVATPANPAPTQDPPLSSSDLPPPAYCEPTSEQCHTETDHPEQGLI